MSDIEAKAMRKVGKTIAGRQLDGRTWDEYPDVETVSANDLEAARRDQ